MDTQGKDKPVVISAENYSKKNIFKYSFLNPKILGLLTVLLLIVGGVGTGVYLTQTPNQKVTQATLATTDISFKPSQTQTEAGSNFNIDVFANANGNKITKVTLTIKYDPDVLDLKSILPRQFLPKVLIAPELASGSASVSLGTDGNSGISGSGIIATLGFQSKEQASGETQISFDDSKTQINILGNPANSASNFESAKITINPKVAPALESTSSSQNPSGLPPADNQAGTSSAADSEAFDLNSDSQINSVDLSVLYGAWGTPTTEIQKKADLNGDGVVNGLDYAKLVPQLKWWFMSISLFFEQKTTTHSWAVDESFLD